MVQIPNPPRLGDMPKGEPVPEGIYHIRCDAAGYKESRQKATPMAECTFTIFGPEDAEPFHGRKLFENMMLAGEGMFKTRQFLSATGEDDDYVLEDTDSLVGRECAAVVVVQKERKDPETGQVFDPRNQIKRFKSLDEA
jgi:hypothetical protein